MARSGRTTPLRWWGCRCSARRWWTRRCPSRRHPMDGGPQGDVDPLSLVSLDPRAVQDGVAVQGHLDPDVDGVLSRMIVVLIHLHSTRSRTTDRPWIWMTPAPSPDPLPRLHPAYRPGSRFSLTVVTRRDITLKGREPTRPSREAGGEGGHRWTSGSGGKRWLHLKPFTTFRRQ